MRRVVALCVAARAANVVYVVTDDQDQMLGSGFPAETTPLRKTKALLADQGVTFVNAFAHVPLCNPSRACTLTGKFFHNIKATGRPQNAAHVRMDAVHDRSFAVDFAAAGYATGLFGKYANAMPRGFVPRGWDSWMAHGNDGTYDGRVEILPVGPDFAIYFRKTKKSNPAKMSRNGAHGSTPQVPRADVSDQERRGRPGRVRRRRAMGRARRRARGRVGISVEPFRLRFLERWTAPVFVPASTSSRRYSTAVIGNASVAFLRKHLPRRKTLLRVRRADVCF